MISTLGLFEESTYETCGTSYFQKVTWNEMEVAEESLCRYDCYL